MSEPNSSLPKLEIESQLKILWKYLQRPSSWFTGIKIKNFLREWVFQANTQKFTNPPILAGRWSAYVHYSISQSWRNLVQKSGLQAGDKVLVHPLVPEFVVTELQALDCHLEWLDIDKNTWQWPPEKFHHLLQTDTFQAVIFYGFTGVYQTLLQNLQEAQKNSLLSLVIIDDSHLTETLWQIFNQLRVGGVMWLMGDSFWDNLLEQVVTQELESRPWFVSWHLEHRTRSSLEGHLQQSHEVFLPIIEAYAYLLWEEYHTYKWWARWQRWITQKLVFRNQLKTPQEAADILSQTYPKSFHSAIPDVVFELFRVSSLDQTYTHKFAHQLEQTTGWTKQAYTLYQRLLQAISERPEGSLEVPRFFLNETYTYYFFFTTEPQYWSEIFTQEGYSIIRLGQLNSEAETHNLPQAQFVGQYGLLLKIAN
jgi:hypothetical protein